MEDVKVSKTELLERVKANRAKHRAIFEDALVGYRAEVIKILDKRLEDAKTGKKINTLISLVEPQDHTADYDAVIDMLEMSLDQAIIIPYHEFRQYVRDEWSWKAQFIQSTAMYNSKQF